jgi:hypothetical protein
MHPPVGESAIRELAIGRREAASQRRARQEVIEVLADAPALRRPAAARGEAQAAGE